MSGEKKHSASSDEYQYADEDIGQESSVEPTQKSTPSLRMIKDRLLERLPKKKKLRVIIILVVAIYIVYKFLNTGSTPPPSVSTPEKIAAQPLSKPAVEVAPVEPVIEKKPIAKPLISTESKKGFNESTTNEQASQMKELQASVNQMNRSVTTLESSLLSLTGSVIGLSNKVSALEKMRQEEKMAVQRNPLTTYYLQSLIPQRAWLHSPAGDFITVKVGDFIPGYGKVQEINVQNGVISTGSGRIISYGPNDN